MGYERKNVKSETDKSDHQFSRFLTVNREL